MTKFDVEFEIYENTFPGFELYTDYDLDTLEQKVLVQKNGFHIKDIWDGQTPIKEYLESLTKRLDEKIKNGEVKE